MQKTALNRLTNRDTVLC